MARPLHYWLDIGDVDPNGIFESQAAVAAAQTLDGAGVISGVWYAQDTEYSRVGPGLGVGLQADDIASGKRHWGRQTVIDVDAASTVTFTVVGYDENGFYATEDIQANGTTAVEGALYFTEITSVTGDGADSSGHTYGTVDEMRSPIFPIDPYTETGAMISVDITGTINYTVHETFDPILNPEFWQKRKREASDTESAPAWIDLQAAGVADSQNAATVGATGIRIQVNSYTNGAELDLHIGAHGYHNG